MVKEFFFIFKPTGMSRKITFYNKIIQIFTVISLYTDN
jgi:hypothetical protein